ncbi:MAG: helix-hairpin-helix domain-containing protein [marine benthic group bacterium]|nr:helix-hairpin-helix domain-containing protein [Candidatus Benthicola marisminoris]
MPSREPSDLRTIPGVGPSIEIDLRALGIDAVADLKDRDPDELYDELCRQRGERIDPCVKYVFRCAVYFARNEVHDPALLQWWNWKEPPLQL